MLTENDPTKLAELAELQKENEKLRESLVRCRDILTECRDKLTDDGEASFMFAEAKRRPLKP